MKQKFLFPLVVVLFIFILPFLYKLPIPLDSISGLYWPMKDNSFGYPNGVPVKNPLITDPVRQQFAWKYLAVKEFKAGHWPLWNPYNFSGTPLLANFQTGAFYPLNILFFLPNPSLPYNELQWFAIQWSWYIYSQTALSIFFLYIYLKKIGLTRRAALFGGLTFAFSGFSVGWWEWGNIIHTLLWFPLILYLIELMIEKDPVTVVESTAYRKSIIGTLFTLDKRRALLLFALVSSFTAGHLQTHILVLINTLFYVLYKIPVIQIVGIKINIALTHRRAYYWVQLIQVAILFLLCISAQVLPSYEFIQKSARALDTTAWQRKDWFFPYQHFVTFFAPDIFGNPTTYNYWGVWNYGEFASYIGILPIILALSVIVQFLFDKYKKAVHRHSINLTHHENLQETLDIIKENAGIGFFLFALFINLVLITRNPLTESFYRYNVPFLASIQPSRGIAIVDFALIVLAAVGFNEMIKITSDKKSSDSVFIGIKTNINYAYLLAILVMITLWCVSVFKLPLLLGVLDKAPDFDVFKVAISNLILPSLLVVIAFVVLRTYFKKAQKLLYSDDVTTPALFQPFMNSIIIIIFCLTFFDLGRYWYKFEAFSDQELLYPGTQLLEDLQNNPSIRYQTEESRIMPPNMNIPYGIYSVDGYDPLYYKRYGQLIGMWDRDKPDLSPYKANRIITPHRPKSIIADISAANYLLSFGDYTKYEKIDAYAMTKLFKIDTVLPRIMIFPSIRGFKSDQDLANYLFSSAYHYTNEALFIIKETTNLSIPSDGLPISLGNTDSNLELVKYSPSQVNINASLTDNPGLLYLADTYDEGWKASVDGKDAPIIRTNFNFRGIQLPAGSHQVKMWYDPQSFRTGLTFSIVGLSLVILFSALSLRK